MKKFLCVVIYISNGSERRETFMIDTKDFSQAWEKLSKNPRFMKIIQTTQRIEIEIINHHVIIFNQ